MTDTVIKCHFCEATEPDVDSAIDADWIPSFFDGDDEIIEPVCPGCQDRYLQIGSDGQIEMKPIW